MPRAEVASLSPRQGGGAYIPTLDGWRAVAIGLVLALHGADSIADVLGAGVEAALNSVFKAHGAGLLGVKIFFAISGFLITSRLLSEEAAEASISLKSFYLRRAFRILPASLLFTGCVGLLGLAGVLPIPLASWLGAVLCCLNYLTGPGTWYLGHYWSLAVEEHFYFLWPGFLALAPRARRLGIAVALALAVGVWRTLAFKFRITYGIPARFWGRTDIQLDGILWGSAMALACSIPRLGSLLRTATRPRLWIVWVVLLAGCHLALGYVGWKVQFAFLFAVPVLIALMVVGTTLHPASPAGRLLELPALRWVGRISYSLYLWQQLFLTFRDERAAALGPLQSLPLNLAAAFACAIASFYLIERPLVRVGHRLAAAAPRPAAVQPVPQPLP